MVCLKQLQLDLQEQWHRRHDRRRDNEGLEDAQRDACGEAAPRPRARKYNGCQQPDEGQVLQAQQPHAHGEGRFDDVHREEEPSCGAQELAHRKARGHEIHGGHGSSRVGRHRREARERPVDGSSDPPVADARRGARALGSGQCGQWAVVEEGRGAGPAGPGRASRRRAERSSRRGR